MTEPEEIARQPLCPTLAHFGQRDAYIPEATVQQFAAAQPQVAVHLYMIFSILRFGQDLRIVIF